MKNNRLYLSLTILMLIATFLVLYYKYNTIEKEKTLTETLLIKHDSVQNQWRNRTLKYPDSIYNLKTKVTLQQEIDRSKKDYMVVSYLDADCSDCVKELNEWRDFLTSNEELEEKFDIIFIASSSNIEMFKYQIYDIAKFQYKTFYDKNNEFINLNKILDAKTYQTILLKENKIVYVGSPIIDRLFEDEFKSIIN